MATLISKLFDEYAGGPILVIGGGPSVSDDLPRLVADGFEPACVISANDHGPKQSFYPVNYLVNVDRWHCEKKVPMQEILRPYVLPIINRHSWADFRLPDWTFYGNSGLTAIAVAVALGGNPVVATGIDMWQHGRYYFHIPIKEQHQRRTEGRMMSKVGVRDRAQKAINPLMSFARGANLRPVSGPLTASFKQYEFGADNFEPAKACEYRKTHRGEPVYIMRVTKPLKFGERDKLNVGDLLPCSPSERVTSSIKTHCTLARTE